MVVGMGIAMIGGLALVAAMQAKAGGVLALEEYKEFFGRVHIEIDPFADHVEQVTRLRATKTLLESPDSFKSMLWTLRSPLCSYEHFVLSSHACYPNYEITEECGRLLFAGKTEAGKFFEAHLEAVGASIEDVKERVIVIKNGEIEMQVINIDGSWSDSSECKQDSSSEEEQILDVLFAREQLLTTQRLAFIAKHPAHFFAPKQKINTAHDMPSKLPLSKYAGPTPSLTLLDVRFGAGEREVFEEIFSPIADLTQIEVLEVEGVLGEAEVGVESVPLDRMEQAWVTDSELLSAFRDGAKTVSIFGNKYTVAPRTLDGDIFVTCVSRLQGLMQSRTAYRVAGLSLFAQLLLRQPHRLIVNGAGDYAFVQCSGKQDLAVLLAKEHEAFINVVGLAPDGAHVLPTSNQPGAGPLAMRTISAMAQGRSTINGAAYVSACMAAMKSRLPFKSWARIVQCVLETATPILLVTDSLSTPFERPVVLKGVRAAEFKPGLRLVLPGGQESVVVSREMFNRSRQKYGMGSFNARAALKQAMEEPDMNESM